MNSEYDFITYWLWLLEKETEATSGRWAEWNENSLLESAARYYNCNTITLKKQNQQTTQALI